MKEYKNSIPFWNNQYPVYEEVHKEEEKLEGVKEEKQEEQSKAKLGCAVLEEAMSQLVKESRVLDFGCGAGWATVYLAQMGINELTALDPAIKGINYARTSCQKAGVCDNVIFVNQDDSYFDEVGDGYFDGFFTSNVLDVIPEDVCLRVIERLHRVIKKGGEVIIMLNPYITQERLKELNAVMVKERHYAINDILRMVLRTDEEWEKFFAEFFEVERIEHFRFDGEKESINRRVFVCKNR